MGGYKNFQMNRNKVTKSYIADKQGNNKNRTTDNLTKSQKLMQGVGKWASFWRKRPDRFVEEVYGLKLKNFQKFLKNLLQKSAKQSMIIVSKSMTKRKDHFYDDKQTKRFTEADCPCLAGKLYL